MKPRRLNLKAEVHGKAVIVDAGDAGEMLIREIERNAALPYDVVGFVVEVARATV